MSKNVLGIDLGTSSVKLLLRHSDGKIEKAKASYEERTSDGWCRAIKKAAGELDISKVDAIGLSSQVGTYIINNKHVINWDDGIGQEELNEIKGKYSREKFIKEIAMPHPDIISYPIPRFLHIKRKYKNIESICQPKDYIVEVLTGKRVSDKYSYRGIVHTGNGCYSQFFLDELGIGASLLPEIVSPFDMVSKTTAECEKITGIKEGIPVFTGLNDFFASIYGMDVYDSGDLFDITGTSEHVGLICDSLIEDTKMVSGIYFDKFIQYGVTASSGASLDFGIREFGFDDISIEKALKNNPPVFTPYVNGERAPIFDKNAKGTFFGIDSGCTKKDLAYSVLEGVVFILYHIYESMGCPEVNNIRVSGGASRNTMLNELKAEMFGKKVCVLSENDTSALGAVQVALRGMGVNEKLNSVALQIEPTGRYNNILKKRYEIYKTLYLSLKKQFSKFSDIGKDLII